MNEYEESHKKSATRTIAWVALLLLSCGIIAPVVSGVVPQKFNLMLILKIVAVALGFGVMIRAFIGIRKYRPGLWESYEAEGIPLELVKQRFRVYQILLPVMGIINGTMIALFFLIKWKSIVMKKWMIQLLAINSLTLVMMIIVYIASKPGCDWLFKNKNEHEEKNRRFVRKMSLIAILILVSTTIIAVVIDLVTQY